MAVTRQSTATPNKITSSTANGDFTHTVDSGTTLSLLFVHYEANESIQGTPTWDSTGVNETFTEIHTSASGGDAGDIDISCWGIVSPTAQTATMEVRFSTPVLPAWIALVNYAGTATASVAAATNYLSEDINTSSGTDNVHASAGNAGNALVMSSAAQGGDTTPASQTVGTTFTEVFNTNTGPDGTGEFGVWYGDLMNSAPSAITIAYSVADQNAGLFIELVAAADSGISALQTKSYQGMNRMNAGFRS